MTRKGLLESSKLGHILVENPELYRYELRPGEFVPYKGRSYCWIFISEEGKIQLTKEMLAVLGLHSGMELLSIRSSNIAFTMGAKGPLLQEAVYFDGKIERY